ncbi:hypothetical protein D9V37_09875 [Nocardioides mangrovicus]|uniref:Uncharacterized protein n=1 Tax=Nocardioides mangrovicus TaxID=2478913 RepID=A0A3L8P1R0_9ACTN|nr:hypothetical protein [Nocardioides mangrovicus]RLV48897.1 hypothetical protein D9V37_09875 [Nocardioides mangrovicus]
MTDTEVLSPEVRDFVERVRHHLRDLGEEERQELTEGLEADLAELVAERGTGVLGDPADYAEELRTAAGLGGRRRRRRPTVGGTDGWLDAAHARWDAVVSAAPGGVAGLLESLRPVWWVLRAWVAAEVVDLWLGDFPYSWVPSMLGPLGWAATLVAVVISVQLGRGVLPLGPLRGLARRLLLLALNVFAIVMLVPATVNLPTGTDVQDAYGEADDYVVPHLAFNGNGVQNVYPYDAAGRPLTGVQLVDQDGRRLSVVGNHCQTFWTNGKKDVYSAFPVPSRAENPNTARCTGPTTVDFPLASLPPVTLPATVAAAVAGATPSAGQSVGPSVGQSVGPAAR